MLVRFRKIVWFSVALSCLSLPVLANDADVKADAKTDAKADSKPDGKPDGKGGGKADAKTDAKNRAMLDVKEESGKERALVDVKERKTKKSDKKKTPPALHRSAVFAIKIEKELLASIDKTVKYLYKTADGLPRKSAQRLQILERILNLKMEQSSYERSEEERLYDKAWTDWDSAGAKGPEPKLDTKKSEEHWKTVISVSSDISKEYPKSKNGDIITYDKAVGLQYLGNEKAAARIFSLLIQRYPNSDIAGDAYASLGDYYFDRNDFRNAQNNYQKAARYKKSKRYLWSLFKLGWCAYNLGQHHQALANWKTVVMQSHMGDQGMQLKDEALRDMVYAFAEVGDIDGAIAYYRANGGDKFIGPFLLLLSGILSDHGQYSQAIDVLKRYQRVAPTAEDGPNAQKEIVSLYAALNKMPMVWRELERFPMLYGPKSAWAAKNDKKAVEDTQNLVKDQIIYYSTLTHQKAIKDNDRPLNKEAKKGYLLFLKFYPNDKQVVGVKYLLADIAYFLKDYREAGRYYMEIGSMGKEKAIRYDLRTNKPSNIHQEVAIDMVRAFVKDFETEFKILKKNIPDFKRPRPVSPKAKNYIEACVKYQKWYPQDAVRVKSCDTSIAAIYYHSADKANSIKYLKVMAFKYATSKEGEGAVELLIPLVKDDKPQLMKLTAGLLKLPSYKNGTIGEKLRALERGSEKESIAKEKDVLKRAKGYESQARKYPKDPEVDKLWYNAATDYIKAGAIPSALVAYGIIVAKFGDKPEAKTAHLQIAKILERQVEYEKAAGYFVSYAQKYPKEKEAPGALSEACELLIAIESDKALKVCSSFAQRYPEGSAPYIERLIIGAERAKQQQKLATLVYNLYLPKYKLSPNDRIVTLERIYHSFDGKGPEAAKAEEQIMAIYNGARNDVSGEALRYVGEIVYKQVPIVMAKYKEVRLAGGSVDKLLQSIQNKAAALQQVEGILGNVLATKDAYWGVAALYQIGLANEMYAEMMENPPAIQGASVADVKKELAPQASARKKVALERYKLAFETVNKYKVYNDWAIKTVNAMARVKDSHFEYDDFIMKPDFLGTMVPSNFVSQIKGED